MISLVDHVAITVKNLQEAINFYSKLGFQLGQRSENPTQVIQFLEAGQARLEVFVPKVPVRIPPELAQSEIGIKHIALKVEDIWKVYEEARSKGVVFNSEPMHTAMGPTVVFFKDPSGILLQLIQI